MLSIAAQKLRPALTKKSIDRSDSVCFSFSFFCDVCGKEWTSPGKPFSGGVCSETENEAALQLLWATEHRASFDEANLEAHFRFINCHSCGTWVCEECYHTANEHHGFCKSCNGNGAGTSKHPA